MGVIHKLREDVVSFIVEHKKKEPSISVRRLAALTSEKFQVNVSKSSVNTTLKKASLSSSVGRRAGSLGRPEKFSIPTLKKKEISERIKESGFVREAPASKKPKEIVSSLDLEEKREAPQSAKEIKDKLLASKEEPSSQRKETDSPIENSIGRKKEPVRPPQRDQDSLQKVDKARHQEQAKGLPILGGMGFVFLKAAQWEISRRSLLAEIFEKHINMPISKRFDSVVDMFLFFKFLGVESFDHISAYRRHGLWALNSFCNPEVNESKDLAELQELFRWNASMQDSPSLMGLIMEYKRMKEQVLLEVKGFKFLLEDKSEMTMDAAMSSFTGGGDVPPTHYGALLMDRAMTKLSNCLISNIQNAVFYKAPGEEKFDRALYDMVAIFEDIPGKKILKMFVLDKNDQKIAEFSIIPSQKRNFLVGLHPRQKEFGEMTKAAKWAAKRSFYHRGADKTIHLSETKTDFIATQIPGYGRQLRIITVWQNEEKEPCWGVLTS